MKWELKIKRVQRTSALFLGGYSRKALQHSQNIKLPFELVFSFLNLQPPEESSWWRRKNWKNWCGWEGGEQSAGALFALFPVVVSESLLISSKKETSCSIPSSSQKTWNKNFSCLQTSRQARHAEKNWNISRHLQVDTKWYHTAQGYKISSADTERHLCISWFFAKRRQVKFNQQEEDINWTTAVFFVETATHQQKWRLQRRRNGPRRTPPFPCHPDPETGPPRGSGSTASPQSSPPTRPAPRQPRVSQRQLLTTLTTTAALVSHHYYYQSTYHLFGIKVVKVTWIITTLVKS